MKKPKSLVQEGREDWKNTLIAKLDSKAAHYFFHRYTFPGWADLAFTGSWVGLVTRVWWAVFGIISLLLYLNVVSLPFLYTVVISFIELGVILGLSILLAVFNVWGDKSYDASMVIMSNHNVSHERLMNIRRSHANAAWDGAVTWFGLLFIIFEVVLVSCFAWGTGNLASLNNNLDSKNYPLRSSAITFDAKHVELFYFRQNIHLFQVVKMIFLVGSLFLGRVHSLVLRSQLVRIALMTNETSMAPSTDVHIKDDKTAVMLANVVSGASAGNGPFASIYGM